MQLFATRSYSSQWSETVLKVRTSCWEKQTDRDRARETEKNQHHSMVLLKWIYNITESVKLVEIRNRQPKCMLNIKFMSDHDWFLVEMWNVSYFWISNSSIVLWMHTSQNAVRTDEDIEEMLKPPAAANQQYTCMPSISLSVFSFTIYSGKITKICV